uniref:Polyols transporter 1 putative polyol transporter protein 1 n=1 Tax=Rhizophora mucronata TaxID=61149 RepID=A0A2P2IU51_RHIMU
MANDREARSEGHQGKYHTPNTA